jgi:hypothetical protein
VEISIPLQYIQTPASRSLQVRLNLRFGLLPDSLKITWLWDRQVCMEHAVDALSVPSDQHTPLSKESSPAWQNDLILEC